MLRLLLLGLNLLNIFNNYHVITKVEDKYDEIIYQDDYYIIYLEDNVVKLKALNDQWIRELNKGKQLSAFKANSDLYIFYYENEILKCITYGTDGKIKDEVDILENHLYNYKIIYDNYFYIIGTIDKRNDNVFKNVNKEDTKLKDCFILVLDNNLEFKDVNIYGGVLNEEFLDISICDDNIYILGKKDILTGGDFGNGGKNNGDIFIARFDFNLEIINFIVINDNSKVVNLISFKSNIYFSTEEYIYKLDCNLDKLISNKLKEKGLFITSSYFNKIIAITKEKSYFFDIINLSLVDEVDNLINIISIKSFSNTLYVKSDNLYYLDIAYLEKIKFHNPIYINYSPKIEVETIYGKAIFLGDKSDIVYDSLVYGIYNRKLEFENIYGVKFYVIRDFEVRKDANVSEGGIYPIGYNLKFRGHGFLNGEAIANNYSISTSGDYTLRLVGLNNEEYSISFKVSDKQISFEEELVSMYHNVVGLGEIYYLTLSYKNEIGEIISVIVDGMEYFDIILNKENKTISVKMNPLNSYGIKYHVINSIKYKEIYFDEEIERSLYVDKLYVVNVIKRAMNINVNYNRFDEYNFRLNDLNTARYFLVSYIYNNEEYVYKYPISTNKIFLENRASNSNITVYLQIFYDLGDKSYRKIDLMEIEFSELNNNDLLEIDVIKKEESLGEFKVRINNDKNISRIKLNDNLIYENIRKDYSIHYAIGFILFVISLFCVYGLKYKKYKKKVGL